MVKHWAAWPPRIRWLAGVAAVVLGLAFVWVLFVPVADWLAHHDVGSATGPLHETALDNARGRLLTLGAGLVAAAALVFTALNLSLLRHNSEQADQWQRRTHELTEQGQVTDRYTKAIEQLGSKEIDVRIGGIYALERIASDSARDYPTVMEVLTAFIREHSHEQWPLPGPDGAEPERLTRADVQAALTVVGRRLVELDIQYIDLSHAAVPFAGLRDATLTGANLRDADLTGANLTRATSPARTSATRTSPARTSPARISPARISATRTSLARTSPARLSPARTSPTRNSPARNSPARTLQGRASPARLSPARLSSARSSAARTSAARTSPARTSAARASPTRPSPARTSAARP